MCMLPHLIVVVDTAEAAGVKPIPAGDRAVGVPGEHEDRLPEHERHLILVHAAELGPMIGESGG